MIDQREDAKGLNRMCARRVMGWTIEGYELYDGSVFLMDACDWRPMEIWSDALRVVDRMGRMGMWFQLQSPFVPGEKWRVGFTPHTKMGWCRVPEHEASHDHPPAAITLAALLAVGAIVSGDRFQGRCGNCGGTEHVDPLPGTVGRRCVRCCGVQE